MQWILIAVGASIQPRAPLISSRFFFSPFKMLANYLFYLERVCDQVQ